MIFEVRSNHCIPDQYADSLSYWWVALHSPQAALRSSLDLSLNHQRPFSWWCFFARVVCSESCNYVCELLSACPEGAGLMALSWLPAGVIKGERCRRPKQALVLVWFKYHIKCTIIHCNLVYLEPYCLRKVDFNVLLFW